MDNSALRNTNLVDQSGKFGPVERKHNESTVNKSSSDENDPSRPKQVYQDPRLLGSNDRATYVPPSST